MSPALQADSLPSEPLGKSLVAQIRSHSSTNNWRRFIIKITGIENSYRLPITHRPTFPKVGFTELWSKFPNSIFIQFYKFLHWDFHPPDQRCHKAKDLLILHPQHLVQHPLRKMDLTTVLPWSIYDSTKCQQLGVISIIIETYYRAVTMYLALC